MRSRLCLVVGLVLSVAICGSWLSAQEKRSDDKGSEAKVEPKVRGQLPPNYAGLGLDDKQKQEIYKVRQGFETKVAELEAQIKKLKDDEKVALEKLLTPAQKARLKEIVKEKAGIKDDK